MSSTSREVLERYNNLLNKTILKYQDPVTGLLPPFVTDQGVVGGDFAGHAWVRDNVYSVLVMWGLSLAYRRKGEGENDRQRGTELEKCVVKQMRSILLCMLRQCHKVEAFKKTFKREDALHAKYSMSTCGTVVGDFEWGHLQIDATSLFLLVLAQLTCSGLQIIYSLDEVSFIQNLVFYIETAYKIPDYGIWERGDKTNKGQTELNATSIGMAKAALEAMSGLDLFGSRGGPSSMIYVLTDQVAQCSAKLVSLLPRESSSKEIDAGLLTIIGFPAFAVESTDVIEETRDKIEKKLLGKYGCKRFLRDGYQTVKEDSSRLYYEAAELRIFDKIECEWPLFLFFLLIDAVIRNDEEDISMYKESIKRVLISVEEGLTIAPELYYVPLEHINAEYRNPGSQPRKPGYKTLHIWAQSMYILSGLLEEGLVSIGEMDPLNRRLSTVPPPDPLVQFVLLTEDEDLCEELMDNGYPTQTIEALEKDLSCPVGVLPAKMLVEAYTFLGVNKKMGLSGRASKKVGVLSTSMLYSMQEKVYAFYPSFLDHEAFYLCLDNELLVDIIHTDVAYIKSNWRVMGCPIMTLPVLRTMFAESPKCPMTKLLRTLKGGYLAGVRVQLGNMRDFISTSCIVNLSFLDSFKGSIWSDEQVSLLRKRSTLSIIQIEEDVGHRPRVTSLSKNSPAMGAVRKSRGKPTLSSVNDPKIMAKIATSPSLGRLQVAAGWSSRRRSLGTGRLLSTPGAMNRRSSDASRRGIATMASQKVEDLIKELEASTDIYDQADILHFVFEKYGRNYDTRVGNQKCTVEMLLEELYGKVGFYKLWSLVRHSAGILKKTVDEISQVATDLLVRQKNFSVGQPDKEIQITQPLPQQELIKYIYEACGNDYSTAALTQELLVYLAMFIRSEPELFNEMLRLRVGLIQNVMATELARALHCSNEDGLEQLLELNPFELKSLLYHILNRQEFTIDRTACNDQDNPDGRQISIVSHKKFLSVVRLKMDVKALGEDDRVEVEEGERQGQWRRRRRIDGALNRVPPDFYFRLWHILEQSEGISIGDKYLPRNPTVHEMTPGELKFAILVESLLNTIPDPEYRQLVVEVLMVCALWVGLNPDERFSGTLVIDDLITDANNLFLDYQKAQGGVAKQCCCDLKGMCEGYKGVCVFFYDSAPSGMFGTMSYLSQAVAKKLGQVLPPNHPCRIS